MVSATATGVARWEYRGRYHDGVDSSWVSEASHRTASLNCGLARFTRCGSCTIRAASGAAPLPETRGARRHPAQMRFPIGTKVIKPVEVGKGRGRQPGQVYYV